MDEMKKKGEHMPTFVWVIIWAIVGVVVVFYIVGGLASTLISASTQISGSGLPLANLFSSTGILFVLFMIFLFVGLIILVAKLAGSHKK